MGFDLRALLFFAVVATVSSVAISPLSLSCVFSDGNCNWQWIICLSREESVADAPAFVFTVNHVMSCNQLETWRRRGEREDKRANWN